jgi:hypothetical protein
VEHRQLNLPLVTVCVICLTCIACVQEEKPSHPAGNQLPFGEVLEPKPDTPVAGPFAIHGWALSENGIKEVAIYEDRIFLADAKLGLSSPEAQKQFPDFPGSTNAGWRFDADPGFFTGGKHELTVQVRSKTGGVRDLASWSIVIGTPFGKMDAPLDGQTFAGPFAVAGWAISEHGMEEVAIYVDGKLLANSHLGLERPDVRAAYPKARDGQTSGWRLEVTPNTLTPGDHEVVARARSKSGAVREIGKAKVSISR